MNNFLDHWQQFLIAIHMVIWMDWDEDKETGEEVIAIFQQEVIRA